MENNKDQNRQQSGGTGSAEHKGQSRESQQNRLKDISQKDQDHLAADAGKGTPVASIRDLGQMSGRDDASGGSGDGMENTSTGEPTER